MTTNIIAKNIDHALIQIAHEIHDNGTIISPREHETKEILNAHITIQDPLDNIVTLPERNLSTKYLEAELAWYESAETNIRRIQEHSSFWKTLADENNEVQSNYGNHAHKQKFYGKTQYEWCLDSLRKDNNTRQALINYNQPTHKKPGTKDFVCTISQQFLLRDNALNSVVTMRSNDAVYGFCYDVPWFTQLQTRISRELNVKIGEYHHFAASMHIYKKHYDMIRRIRENYERTGEKQCS